MRPKPFPANSFRLLIGLALLCGPAARGSDPAVGLAAAEGPDRGARQPQVAVAASGRIYVAFGRDNEVRCAASADGGRTFATTTVGSPGTLALGMRRGPRVAVAGDAVIVTAIGGAQGKGKDGDVMAWTSRDGGATWSGPARINAVPGSAREGLHGLAADPSGRAFCTWLDLRSGAMEVWGARSSDGATWEPDARVYRAPDGPICPCCHPSAAFGPDGTLAVMWRNSLAGNRDLHVARSADGGRTFGPASKLGRRSWKLDACPMDGGALALGPGGKLASAWMRAGSAFATDGPEGDERPLGPGVQPWVALGPDGPVPVWLDRRPGRLLALRPGRSEPEVLAESANDPAVAAAPGGRGPVVAAWESPSGPDRIAVRVLTPGDAPAPGKGRPGVRRGGTFLPGGQRL